MNQNQISELSSDCLYEHKQSLFDAKNKRNENCGLWSVKGSKKSIKPDSVKMLNIASVDLFEQWLVESIYEKGEPLVDDCRNCGLVNCHFLFLISRMRQWRRA